MKIQKGDKLLCKKRTFDGNLGVIENEWYDIIKFDELPLELSAFTQLHFSSYIQVNGGGVYNYNFSLDKKNKNYIWDYFYTKQEIRKYKLEKINRQI